MNLTEFFKCQAPITSYLSHAAAQHRTECLPLGLLSLYKANLAAV